jgi:SAM-dependent methyltransferase
MKQELVNNPPLARLQRFFGAIGGMAPHKQVALMATLNHRHIIRRHVAGKRLAGRGIEIGAQFLPTIAPDHPHARVEYLDRLSSEELSRRYGMPLESLVPVSHIADASNLSLFRDSELDFLIAHHVLEHFDDPIGGMLEWLRVLRPGGRLFITLPNRLGNEYDFERPLIDIAHLKADHTDPAHRVAGNLLHYQDFVRYCEVPPEDWRFEPRVKNLMEIDERIHFHVFEIGLLSQLLQETEKLANLRLGVVDQFFLPGCYELSLVLEKDGKGRSLPLKPGWRLGYNALLLALLAYPQVGRRLHRIQRHLSGASVRRRATRTL